MNVQCQTADSLIPSEPAGKFTIPPHFSDVFRDVFPVFHVVFVLMLLFRI